MQFDLSTIKHHGDKARTTTMEREDLFELLESLSPSQCKELYDWVKANKKEFTETEIELYQAASKPGGLAHIRLMDKKKKRAKLAGMKLSDLKKGAFEDDAEWEAIVNGESHVKGLSPSSKNKGKSHKTAGSKARRGKTAAKKKVRPSTKAKPAKRSTRRNGVVCAKHK